MTPPFFPIAPLASDLPNLIGSEGRALETFFPLCGTRWGFFWGCAYAPDSNRLIAPTSGIGGPPVTGHKINIYEETKGIRQPRQLAQTFPNGCPVYVESVDKFFLGISTFIPGGGIQDTAFATVTPTSTDVDPAFKIEYIGGFDTAGFVTGGKAIYISSKDRVWILLTNSTGQIAEIDPSDNSFTIITDAALSAITDFEYCPDDDNVYCNCFSLLKKIDVNTFAVSTVDITAAVTATYRVHAMTWVPDNGVDPSSGRIWVSVRDETGFQFCHLLRILPTANTYLDSTVGTASDFYVVMTFIPEIERIVAQKSLASLATNFISYAADLTSVGIADRNLTGNGCYVDSLDKAALPVLKDGAWCIEYYTQAELT